MFWAVTDFPPRPFFRRIVMDDQKTIVVSVHAKDCVDYQCRRCGQCCRHIKDAVMVESLDAYLPFNKRYRPEVWRAAHIVYVRNECCHKISPVTQEQIDHAYNGTIPCPHCGRWSEFIVLGIRLQPEPLVPCLSCDCHDPDMGCTMPSIDKSYACPLVSCDDEQTEVLDE